MKIDRRIIKLLILCIILIAVGLGMNLVRTPERDVVVHKPVIYLYPENQMDVEVILDYPYKKVDP